MNLSDAKMNTPVKPVIDDGKLYIAVKHEAGIIKEFKVKVNGVTKLFPVKNGNIVTAWKELEQYLKKQK